MNIIFCFMNNRPFFQRNGADELNVTLIVLSILLFLLYPIFDNEALNASLLIVSLISLSFALFRTFSTNLAKRRAENDRFVSFFKEANKEEKKRRKKAEKEKKQKRKEDEKIYSFFFCPKCHKELRVPKGRGKIKIKCPNCSEEFIRKS